MLLEAGQEQPRTQNQSFSAEEQKRPAAQLRSLLLHKLSVEDLAQSRLVYMNTNTLSVAKVTSGICKLQQEVSVQAKCQNMEVDEFTALLKHTNMHGR